MSSPRAIALFAILMLPSASAIAEVVDFDDLSLAPNSHWNGPDPNGTTSQEPGGFTRVTGSFDSHGVTFVNRFDTYDFGQVWSSFAYSNHTDATTPGFENQFSAFTGGGRSTGADNYGVAFGSGDANIFNPANVADLLALPSLTIPAGSVATGMYVTNTTYAALTMLDGNGFAGPFGGMSGDDPDWFKLTVYGLDALGVPLPESVELYLADYRFADDSLDYILDDWTFLDLSSLAGAQSLHFNLTSSDVGEFGMNTPAFFAMDDLQLAPAAVPEPSSMLLLLGSLVTAGAIGRVRRLRRAQ